MLNAVAPEIDLWVTPVAEMDLTQLDLSLLDEEERSRAARMRGEDRSVFLAAHVLLRQRLAERLGTAPEEIAYRRDPCPRCGSRQGRPALERPRRPALERPRRPLYFSLSRRAGVVMIGIAPALVGVDVEALPAAPTVSEVAELLHPAERDEILSTPAARRPEAFARVWARKEAYLKGVGTGVGHGLDSEYVGAEDRVPGPTGWTITDVPAPTGYGAAVAVQSVGGVNAHV